MLRFTSLVLLAACAGAPPKPQPAPLANTQPTTTYQLAQVYIPGREGRHSASHSSTNLTGSLELTGERAKLVLEFATTVGYIQCPKDRTHWPQHQACHESPPKGGSSQSTLELAGTAKRTGNELHIDASVTRQPNPAEPPQTITVKLVCKDVLASLACTPVTESYFDPLGTVPKLDFHRVRFDPPARAAAIY